MADIRLHWQRFTVDVKCLNDWKSLVRGVDPEIVAALKNSHAVYVIRTARPFSFAYTEGHSPVIYIGKGRAQTRLSSHLKTWLLALAQSVPTMKIEIAVCTPRARWHGQVCEEVEADLLYWFEKIYGDVPIRNRRREYAKYLHSYQNADLKILRPGAGRGYVWGLTPLRSSALYKG